MEGGERDAERELRMHALRKLGDEVEDAFSGASALQRFGVGDALAKVEERQLEKLNEMVELQKRVVEVTDEPARLFRLR